MIEQTLGHKASNKLVKLLLKTAAISSILILVFVSYAITQLYNQHVLDDARHDAVSVSQAILGFNKHLLLTVDQHPNEQLSIPPHRFEELDAMMQRVLAPFKITKVKVYSINGKILYSTDHSIIGRDDHDNPSLQIALAGGTSSNRKIKTKVTDLYGETLSDIEVAETYIPIKNSKNKVIGSFEIYQDISFSQSKSKDGITKALITLAIILFLVFSLSLLVVRIAAKELHLFHYKLHKMATEDPLTRAQSRSSIISMIKESYRRQKGPQKRETAQAYSLIMEDADNFKAINDNFGHLVGDKALQLIAATIRQAVRDQDQIGRYGGEEFLLLLPNTDQRAAEQLAEAIRCQIEAINFTENSRRISLTISLGVASMKNEDSSYEDAIKRADEALYCAKHNGRNRVSTS